MASSVKLRLLEGSTTLLQYDTDNNLSLYATSDATNSASGGTLTVAGGAAIAKSLFVGGNLSVTGTLTYGQSSSNIFINDNIILLNSGSLTSRDTGIMFQKFQNANDTGVGDVVDDPQFLSFTLGDQTGTNLTSFILPPTANTTNNFYQFWWVRVTSGSAINQVRRIASYTGATRTATIETSWTTAGPVSGDTVQLYYSGNVGLFYRESENTLIAGITPTSSDALNVSIQDHAVLRARTFEVMDTTPSTSTTAGALRIPGGVSISVTTDATSASNSGSLTTAGGIAVGRRAYFGGAVFATATDTSTSSSTGALVVTGGLGVGGALNVSGASSLSSLSITGTTPSTSTSTGALVVPTGGVGIGGALNVGNTSSFAGNVTMSATTVSTSTTSGALVVTGGAGIGGNLYIRDHTYLIGNFNGTLGLNLENASTGDQAGTVIRLLTDTGLNNHGVIVKNGNLRTVDPNSMFVRNNQGDLNLQTTGSIGVQLSAATSSANVQYTTESTSITTGGLTVAGGLGISKALWVGGNANITRTVNGSSTVNIENTSTGTSAMSSLHLITNTGLANMAFIRKYGSLSSVEPNTLFIQNIQGAVQMQSGGGFGFQLNAAGTNMNIQYPTASTSPLTGSLTVAGGVGINGNLYVSGLVMHQTTSTNGDVTLITQNSNAGANTRAILQVATSTGLSNAAMLFKNGPGKTTEGGANAAVLRNPEAALLLQGNSTSAGMTLTASQAS
ncbi:hypothetical protein HK102_009165, partial [Quaeritorhiza haematococci]